MKMVTREMMEVFDDHRELFDAHTGAHGERHVFDVFRNLCSDTELRIEVAWILAYCHDLFSGTNENNHEEMGANFVELCPDEFIIKHTTREERVEIADAIRNHRASRNVPDSPGSMTLQLRSADSGKLVAINVIKRSIKHYGSGTPREIAENVLQHMKDKFYRDGYLYDEFRKPDNGFIEDLETYDLNAIEELVVAG
jgi:hypothetical protein